YVVKALPRNASPDGTPAFLRISYSQTPSYFVSMPLFVVLAVARGILARSSTVNVNGVVTAPVTATEGAGCSACMAMKPANRRVHARKTVSLNTKTLPPADLTNYVTVARHCRDKTSKKPRR